ncbi:MAG: outer membrane beta-barrel protein [Bacteroidales bacterium]|nr:outer membrane beta-barrel protein [Bacteroidales bacterium]MDT8433017.1 outer membrane beta-barrel protein [Bacteroidales bacterium]
MNLKKLHRNLLLLGLLISIAAPVALNAQSRLLIDASQQVTNFRFMDSEGVLDKAYSPVYSGAYNVGYAYELDFGLFFRGGVGMRQAGATMVYDAANYQWDLQYLSTKIGAGYQIELGMFSPYITVSGFYGFLLKANQRINNEDFDIIESGAIIRHDVGIIFSPGVNVNISEAITVYGEFSFLKGLQNVEAESDGKTTFSYLLGTGKMAEDATGQVSTNTAYAITLGLSFAIQ